MEAKKDYDGDLKMNVVACNNQTLIQLVSPDTDTRKAPFDICCVIDTSGSMEDSASIKNEQGKTEEFGLTILDVVKHAVKTIISSLSAQDRLAIVEFHSQAKTVLSLTLMTDEGKTRAQAELDKLTPLDSTNLWDGLYTGLEILRNQSAPERVASLMILTDGQPNVNPPRGHIPMLLKYKEDNKEFPCQINTFGFGYNLDSQLLNDIAVESQGTYSFIPDSSFVGTVFVNSMSNILSTYASHIQLFLEPQNQMVLAKPPLIGGHRYTEASWGLLVEVGSMNYGQTKDFIINTQIPDNLQGQSPYASVKVAYRIAAEKEMRELKVEATKVENSFDVTKQALRLQVVDQIKASMQLFAESKQKEAASQFAPISQNIKNLLVTNDKYLAELLKDVDGQIKEALSKDEWYTKWGRHYLPSLACAHQLQQCNNFKDPGVQNYGGILFKKLRDIADANFLKIPPPKPTKAVYDQHGKVQQS